jgi:N4-gp56 family major capsid protein
MARQTYLQQAQRTDTYAAAMLRHAEPQIVAGRFGRMYPLPRNKANNQTFRRRVPFTVDATASTVGTEGDTPTPHTFDYEDVAVTLVQYADLVEITDVVADLSEDDAMADATVLSGEHLGATMESICIGVLHAATNAFFSNGTSKAEVNTIVSQDAVRNVIRTLKKQKAMPVTRVLGATTGIGTRPVEPAYICLIHSDCENDLRGLTGFTPVAQYGTRQPVHELEIGSIENTRFITSADMYLELNGGAVGGTDVVEDGGGTGADIYPWIFIGQDAYGHCPVQGRDGMTVSVVPVSQQDKNDPLGQRGYVGWKRHYAAVRLNENWMGVLWTAITDLSN